jgi:serine acetyltransferase
VLTDVPSNSIAVGIPARIIPRKHKEAPAETHAELIEVRA